MRASTLQKPGLRIKTVFPLLLLVFLLIFPKGGIKISDIPVTWGYLLLCLSCFSIFFRKIHGIFHAHFQVFLALIPFQCVALFHFLMVGVSDWGFGISFILHFILFPCIFFLFFSKSIAEINFSVFLEFLKNGIFLIAAYGILLFIFVHTFGFFFTIPFLTVNWNDLGLLETTKCIVRGDFFKLISTYNNGNIYGICVLILLPLYCYLEQKVWKRRLVKLSLILTLSRTVWIGLVMMELLQTFYIQKNRKHLLLKTLVFIALLSLILLSLKQDISFIFDPTLGGRYTIFFDLEDFYWIGRTPFQGFSEIVYLSLYKSFGVFGLISFLFGITSPLWIYYFSQFQRKVDPSICGEETFQKSIILGLCLYLILSCSDGAILFIPVMAFYWFLSALLLISPNIQQNRLQVSKKISLN